MVLPLVNQKLRWPAEATCIHLSPVSLGHSFLMSACWSALTPNPVFSSTSTSANFASPSPAETLLLVSLFWISNEAMMKCGPSNIFHALEFQEDSCSYRYLRGLCSFMCFHHHDLFAKPMHSLKLPNERRFFKRMSRPYLAFHLQYQVLKPQCLVASYQALWSRQSHQSQEL